ncbi:hypothetical protein CMUS01_10958 [Colletotrichum musicola]|uniref:Uncharacterized protein n=1 Tax=Colletotrichum musicola TaxID=2175873 RepID=A0A8H6K0E0_9PEZI|nr:hypothetical protein CMUS01_10958 [Colletotrichum musicola]
MATQVFEHIRDMSTFDVVRYSIPVLQFIYEFYFAPHILRDCDDPYYLAIGERGFTIQTEYLRIPPRFGLFSGGPGSQRGREGIVFLMAVRLMVFSYLYLALCGI